MMHNYLIFVSLLEAVSITIATVPVVGWCRTAGFRSSEQAVLLEVFFSADSKVCLDQILIQLKEVAPHWRRLGEAVGVGRLDEISQYVCQTWEFEYPCYCVCVSLQVGSESDAMVEVVDGWLAQLHPNKPTWREIADVVDSIGHHDLALSLRQVYVSGDLHCNLH